MVVIATVEPVANSETTPRSIPDVRRTLCTPGVMSTMWPWPGVSSASMPPWTVIDPATSADVRGHAHPGEASLAELEHLAVDEGRGQIESAVADRLAVQLDPALGQGASRLGGRDRERVGQQRRQMDLRPVGRPAHGGHLLRRAVLDEHSVELRLG